MNWHQKELRAFDVESTGVDVTTARIVTATVVKIVPPGTVHERSWLLDPGLDIPDEAAAIHGITTEHAREHGQPAAGAVMEIALAVADATRNNIPLIIYNAPYDLSVLDAELRRHGHPPLEELAGRPVAPVIDPLCIDRAVDRYRRGKRTLTAACEHYKVNLDGAHDAAFDAIAAARLAWRLATVYPQVGGVDVMELHEQQVGWYAEWAAHFAEYLASQGKAETIDPQWPIRRAVVPA